MTFEAKNIVNPGMTKYQIQKLSLAEVSVQQAKDTYAWVSTIKLLSGNFVNGK